MLELCPSDSDTLRTVFPPSCVRVGLSATITTSFKAVALCNNRISPTSTNVESDLISTDISFF